MSPSVSILYRASISSRVIFYPIYSYAETTESTCTPPFSPSGVSTCGLKHDLLSGTLHCHRARRERGMTVHVELAQYDSNLRASSRICVAHDP